MITALLTLSGAFAAGPHPHSATWIRSCIERDEAGCSQGWTEIELGEGSGRYDWWLRREYGSRYHRYFQPSQLLTWCERDDNGLACTLAGGYGDGDLALLARGCQLGDPEGCALYALVVARERALTSDERRAVQEACRDGSPRACALWLDGALQDPTWGRLSEASRHAQVACNFRGDWLSCAVVARQVAAEGRPELAGRIAVMVHAGSQRMASPGRVLTAPLPELAAEMAPSLAELALYHHDEVRPGALRLIGPWLLAEAPARFR